MLQQNLMKTFTVFAERQNFVHFRIRILQKTIAISNYSLLLQKRIKIEINILACNKSFGRQ
jgi:hypothetical protein